MTTSDSLNPITTRRIQMKIYDEGYHLIPRGSEYRQVGEKLYVTLDNGDEYCFLPGAIVNSEEAMGPPPHKTEAKS